MVANRKALELIGHLESVASASDQLTDALQKSFEDTLSTFSELYGLTGNLISRMKFVQERSRLDPDKVC
jgi:hypothetical protein